MKKKVEKKVADTILQKPVEIKINGRTFIVPRPTIGTLIMMSSEIAELPAVDTGEVEADDMVQFVLSNAKECTETAKILAISLLGAKYIKEHASNSVKGVKKALQRVFCKQHEETLEELTEWLNMNASPQDITTALSKVLQTMEVGDFFACITFLGGVNIMKPKKVI